MKISLTAGIARTNWWLVLRRGGAEVRQVTLEVRYTDRDESRKSVTLNQPAALDTDFLPLLPGLLEAAWQRRVRLRAMTLRATREAEARLAATIDALRKHWGAGAVRRGWEMEGANAAA